MSASSGAIVLSTPDPQELAAFYRDLLGWSVITSESGWVRLRQVDHERPSLSFQYEPADTPPSWPMREGGVQMQAHLDVLVDDLDSEQQRAAALGASLETHQPNPDVRVMRDPHGHVFCLFLAGA
ncbi:VOC family protein [Nocardioides sp.]|uniref:VOC family protein n=1 Tax=Nocardioides sp. TaxID=35761 RepID=UPI003D0C58DD